MVSFYCTKWIKYRVLTGLFLINLSGGFTVFYGNLYAYAESYYRFRLPPDRNDLAPEWILSTCLISLPIGNLVAGPLQFKLGFRMSVFISVLMYNMGFFLSYLSMMNSIWATALTFGAIGIFGLGILEVLCYSLSAIWFPQNQGLAGSIICASGSIGAILFNVVITAYINPGNLKPDYVDGDMAYFSQCEVIHRVPMVFVILGAITLFTQLLGFIMIKTKEGETVESNSLSKTKGKHHVTSMTENKSFLQDSLSRSTDCLVSNEKDLFAYERKDKEKDRITFNELSEDHQNDKSPKQVLKSPTFYILWFSLMVLSFGIMVVSNYYKFFAQVWITDDIFLTFVGNSSAFASTIARVLMGFFIDKFRIKTIFIGTMSTLTVSLVFWYFTAIANRWIYFVCTNYLAGLTSAIFVLYPLASLKFFGMTYFATNTGLIMLAMTGAELISAPIMVALIMSYGWFWLFFTVSFLTAVSLVVVVALMPRAQIIP